MNEQQQEMSERTATYGGYVVAFQIERGLGMVQIDNVEDLNATRLPEQLKHLVRGLFNDGVLQTLGVDGTLIGMKLPEFDPRTRERFDLYEAFERFRRSMFLRSPIRVELTRFEWTIMPRFNYQRGAGFLLGPTGYSMAYLMRMLCVETQQ